jgi:hypothetical protein
MCLYYCNNSHFCKYHYRNEILHHLKADKLVIINNQHSVNPNMLISKFPGQWLERLVVVARQYCNCIILKY